MRTKQVVFTQIINKQTIKAVYKCKPEISFKQIAISVWKGIRSQCVIPLVFI